MRIIGSSNWMGSLIGIPLTSSHSFLLQATIGYHFDWQCSDVCRNCGAHVMMDMLKILCGLDVKTYGITWNKKWMIVRCVGTESK